MLGGSDRLRIIAKILELDEEDFLKRFANTKNRTVADARESVRGWWSHRRDPVKDEEFVIQALQARAGELGKSLNIAKLWQDKDLTPGEFAAACGTSIFEVADDMSPILRRTCFELTDRLPFLRLIRHELNKRRQPQIMVGDMSGFYDLYRIHSSERELCLESLQIDQTGEAIAPTGTYVQYQENHRIRTIGMSFLTGERWLHAIGAYVDQGTADQSVLSLVHMTIITSPYRHNTYSGLLHDVIDNKSAVAAQRILLVRRKAPSESAPFKPSLLKDIAADQLIKYVKFLRNGSDQLAVDYNLMASILNSPITAQDRESLLS